MYFNLFSGILAIAGAVSADQLTFPLGFKFGSASSAYQVEGAWNVSDKGENIWDRIIHTTPDFIRDLSSGDVACDSYHLWEEDLKIIAELGLDFHRFSISWPRLLPSGFSNKISEDGRRYYNDLIDGLLARGIEPIVTIFHWDLPQSLQDLGGWTNPLIVDWFADYARVVFSLFGDRVKTWITINEPMVICDSAYRGGAAPGFIDYENGALLCSKYVVLAHAKAYRVYEKEFKAMYGGLLSFANEELWLEPETEQDLEITLLARDYANHRYTNPVYSVEGGWPPVLEKYFAEKSEQEGYPRSRLPAFTKEEIDLVRGSYDFFALNHYTSRTVRAARSGEELGGYMIEGIEDINAVCGIRPEWETSKDNWIKFNPEGLRNCLKLIKQQYGDVKVLISENGFQTRNGSLEDPERIRYYQEYLKQVLLAMYEDGVSVMGYTAWSLMDNFEWTGGYAARFGLYSVDFADPLRPRTPKASAHYYAELVRTRTLEADNSTE